MSKGRKALKTTAKLGGVLLSTLLMAQPIAAQARTGNVIQLTLWHAMSGVPATALAQLVDDFNKSHKNIQVNLVYQGQYDDEFNKWKATQGSSGGPNIMQVYDIGTRFMIDSKQIVPMQNFINQSHYNFSQLEPNILGYYSIGRKLYSMPFNSSQPVLYYNQDMFKAAGITSAPTTYAQVIDDAKKLTKKDASGHVQVYGVGIADYGWFFEQMLGTQGGFYANNQNGRKGTATAAMFDNHAATTSLSFWKTLYSSGDDLNLGSVTSLTQQAFDAGQTAMIIDSSGTYGSLKSGANGKFQVGIAPFPKPAGAKGGPIIGGGSLWIPKNQSAQDQQAAWKFVQFVVSPQEQAKWSEATGYFPVTRAAYKVPSMRAYLKANPMFNVAINQLHHVKLTTATQGALIGVFSQARQDIQNMIAAILLGQQTIQGGLASTQSKVTQEIAQYNQTVGH